MGRPLESASFTSLRSIAMISASDSNQLLEKVLSLPPQVPRNVSLYSSNTLFGEPGIYPNGSAMEPANGDQWSESHCREVLVSMLGPVRSARFEHPVLTAMCPDPSPRAALVLLSSTIATPLLEAFLVRRTPVTSLSIGVTRSPGRVVGPVDGGPDEYRVVNSRYRAEHPALMASSIAHDLLWNVVGAGQFEEATLHMIVALVHLQLVALHPEIAHTGSELARRQNSLAISLLNSRQPGDSKLRVIAPDGPGTIPGGAPGMQSFDFWSIPFVGGDASVSAAPPLLTPVLQLAVGVTASLEPVAHYDQELGQRLSELGLGGALALNEQLRVMVALGLLDEVAISEATQTDVSDVAERFHIHRELELFHS